MTVQGLKTRSEVEMSIFVDETTKIVVQGITGRDGSFHAKQMREYGSKVVAGVTPGKGGQDLDGIPIFNTVREAVDATGANTSVIYVPVAFAIDAIYEAADAGVKLVVCITEGVPANDMLSVYNYLKSRDCRLIGPNCPGIISPGKTKVGIMPGQIHAPGRVGLVSRSGTLTYEIVYNLTLNDLGQSTCIGIGGDQIIGTNFIDCLAAFEADPETDAIVMIGEIGGTDEEEAADYIREHLNKPVVAFIAGRAAPPGKRMAHAGAIISGGSGTAAEKIVALNAVGIPVAETPAHIADLTRDALERVDEVKKQAEAKKKAVTKKKATPKKKTVKKKAAKKTVAKKKTATKKKAAPKKKVAKKKPVVKKKAAKKRASAKKTVARKPAKKKIAKKKVAKKSAGKKAPKKKAATRKTRTKEATKKKAVKTRRGAGGRK
jgi:succinyl-CoA synthetase alpha subunit